MSWLMDLLKDVPISAVMQERLQLADDRAKQLQDRIQALEDENAALKGEVARLRQQVPDTKFVDVEGVLWKLGQNGQVKSNPYCPKCKLAMSELRTEYLGNKFRCTQCKFTSPFDLRKGAAIRSSLTVPTNLGG